MVIFYDGEYSGLDTTKGHGILSVAVIDGNNPKNRFYRECRLNECQTFDPFSLKIVDLNEKEIYTGKDKFTLESTMNDFQEWFLEVGGGKKECVVSQNNPKDLEQLWNGFKVALVKDPLHYRNLDLHTVAHTHHTQFKIEIPTNDKVESNLNSSYLSNYVGIPDEPKPHSTALACALQTT
jgi:hypothetical protein